jgi:hypothetical protein
MKFQKQYWYRLEFLSFACRKRNLQRVLMTDWIKGLLGTLLWSETDCLEMLNSTNNSPHHPSSRYRKMLRDTRIVDVPSFNNWMIWNCSKEIESLFRCMRGLCEDLWIALCMVCIQMCGHLQSGMFVSKKVYEGTNRSFLVNIGWGFVNKFIIIWDHQNSSTTRF